MYICNKNTDMKILLLILSTTLYSCTSTTIIYPINKSSLTDDINESIINDFYNGDTTNLSSTIYLLD